MLNHINWNVAETSLKLERRCEVDFYNWDVAVCLHFLHVFLEKIKRELDAAPEGSILVAKRAACAHQFTFQLIGLDDLARQSEWEVVSEEFKVSVFLCLCPVIVGRVSLFVVKWQSTL